MKILPTTSPLIIWSDENYSHAANYIQSLYNFPITLNYGDKHDRAKYILSAGTSDHITILQDGIFLYIISENTGLSYIGLQIINTELKEEEGTVFLNEQDCTGDEENTSYGIFDKDSEDQLKILLQYV